MKRPIHNAWYIYEHKRCMISPRLILILIGFDWEREVIWVKRKNVAALLMILIVAGFAYRCYVVDKPIFAVAISSNSMSPMMSRGDVIFIRSVRPDTVYYNNQIILFKSEENKIKQWTLHRIVGGCSEHGYLTKGDSNCREDQHCLGYPPVKSEWIGGTVPKIGSKPLKIPKLGYITLLLDENLKTPPLVTGLVINCVFLTLLVLGLKTLRCAGRYCRQKISNG